MGEYVEKIKLLASELKDASPRTQLEIVKKCKDICIDMAEAIENGEFVEASELQEIQETITDMQETIASLQTAVDTTLPNLINEKKTYIHYLSLIFSNVQNNDLRLYITFNCNKSEELTENEIINCLNNDNGVFGKLCKGNLDGDIDGAFCIDGYNQTYNVIQGHLIGFDGNSDTIVNLSFSNAEGDYQLDFVDVDDYIIYDGKTLQPINVE